MTINRLRTTLQNLIAKTQERIDEGEGEDSLWVAGHLDGLLYGYRFALDQLPVDDLVPESLESAREPTPWMQGGYLDRP